MGMLTDYFRAPDAAAAAVVDGPEWAGPLFPQDGAEPFDGVEAKQFDPWVTLGQLVAFVRDVPYSSDLVEMIWVRPTESELEEAGDSPESAVVQLGDDVRDALASVTAGHVPELAARWARIEEFSYFSDVHEVEKECARVLTELAALSRRAQAAGEHVYCWWSV